MPRPSIRLSKAYSVRAGRISKLEKPVNVNAGIRGLYAKTPVANCHRERPETKVWIWVGNQFVESAQLPLQGLVRDKLVAPVDPLQSSD